MSEVTVHIVAKVHYKFLLTLKDRSDQTYRNTSKLPSNKIMYVCNMFGDWNWRYQSFDMKCQLRLKDPCCRILGWLLFLTPPKKNEGILNQPLAACYILQPINTFKVHVGSLFNGHRDEERQEKGQPWIREVAEQEMANVVLIFLVPPKR